MIVCICRRVSDRDIQREVHNGCLSFDALQEETGVASACGACHDCARASFQQACGERAHGGTRAAAQPMRLHRGLGAVLA